MVRDLNRVRCGSPDTSASARAARASWITVAEALVRAVSSSFEEGIAAQTALRRFPHLTVAPLDFDIAVDVAHIRGATKLKMPDVYLGDHCP